MPPAKDNNCYLNFLATHDGIGIRLWREPLEGILNLKRFKNIIENT